jgi:beta-1,2-mannobiose phosphorylase / 1,2-beta-oligomannan phosphorylase
LNPIISLPESPDSISPEAFAETTTGLPLFTRYAGNPILTQSNWPYTINSVFNAAAVRLPDGDTLLLCRVEDRRGLSHLCAARSANGMNNWRIDPQPTLAANPRDYPEELWGIEDPRITYVPELEQYAVVYTSFSRGGPGVSLAMTKDFKSFERYGVIMQPEDKDAALLPRRFGGLWALIHRPVTTLGAHMWISYSSDLRQWGSHKIILEARRGGWWDANKIGLCSPPIETAKGWLTIYHGVRQTASGSIYRLGLALFDLERPEVCLQRGDSWVFGPEAPYERNGDVKDVVFPCGQTIGADGDTIYLYYGAADSSIALATGSIRALLAWLESNSSAWEETKQQRDLISGSEEQLR